MTTAGISLTLLYQSARRDRNHQALFRVEMYWSSELHHPRFDLILLVLALTTTEATIALVLVHPLLA